MTSEIAHCNVFQFDHFTLLFESISTQSNLRKYEVLSTETNRQDMWQAETRKRQTGKLAGGLYKVWISPNGAKFYSGTKAAAAGFKNEEQGTAGDETHGENASNVKGRRKRQKKA